MENLKLANGESYNFNYRIMDLDSVIPSHNPFFGFCKSERYAYENERQYNMEDASQSSVLTCACNLDSDHLMESNFSMVGAPIVDHNLNVLGGNGRCMAILYASEKFRGKYMSYVERVKAYALEKGMACPEKPILVRQLCKEIDVNEGQKLVVLLNDDFAKSKTKKADAKSRGSKISQKTLELLAIGLPEFDSLRQYFDNQASLKTVESLIADGAIMETEKNSYIQGGYLNPEGKTLIESALRSMIFPSYQSLSKMPAPMIAKIDSAIPYIIIANSQNYSINSDLGKACEMISEYLSGNYKYPELYLNQMDILRGMCPADFYGKLATCFFMYLLESSKKDFVTMFKKFSSLATQASEPMAEILGIAKSYEDAIFAVFGVKIEKPENKASEAEIIPEEQETINTEKEDNTMPENTSEKPVKRNRTSKNDCTKDNSTLIKGKETDDLQDIIDLASEILGSPVELIANSKTQYRLAIAGKEIDGYRIIRTGKRYQIRLLNGYNEYEVNKTENNTASENINSATEDNTINYEVENNIPEDNTNIIKKIIEAFFACLVKLGWQDKGNGFLERNLYGGTKGGQANPIGNRIFHISSHKNEIFLQYGWENCLRYKIYTNTNPEFFAKNYNSMVIDFARKTGNYVNPETLDGAIKIERNAYQEKIEAKREYYTHKAEKIASEAQVQFERAKEMASVIPLGQPILIDHYSAKSDINYRNKIHNLYGKSFQNMDKATYYQEKSEKYGSHSISSDNPDAIYLLKKELQGLLDNHEKMKDCNKVIKNKNKSLSEKCEYVKSVFPYMTNKEIINIVKSPYGDCYNGFNLASNSQNIKRVKDRIAELENRIDKGNKTIEYNLFTYEENIELNRVMFYFPDKPDYETRELLKSHGFRWSPRNKAWQRMLNNNGIREAQFIIEKLGAIIESEDNTEIVPENNNQERDITEYIAMPEYILPEGYLPVFNKEDTGITIKEYLGRKTLAPEDRKDKETVIARAKVLNNIRAKDDLIIWKDKDGLYHFNLIEDTQYINGEEFYIIDGDKYKRAFIPALLDSPKGQSMPVETPVKAAPQSVKRQAIYKRYEAYIPALCQLSKKVATTSIPYQAMDTVKDKINPYRLAHDRPQGRIERPLMPSLMVVHKCPLQPKTGQEIIKVSMPCKMQGEAKIRPISGMIPIRATQHPDKAQLASMANTSLDNRKARPPPCNQA